MVSTLARLRNEEEGFTLIELMIVMIVLGILAGIVLFAVGSFDEDAEDARDSANTRICETAFAASEAKYGNPDNWEEYVATGTTCP